MFWRNSCGSWSQIWPLDPNTKLILWDRVLGEVEKNSFIALSGKGGPSKLTPSKLCVWPGGGVGSLIVMVQKGMISSWTFFWLVGGEVSGSEHHQPSDSNRSGDHALWTAYYLILPPSGGFNICKTTRRYCYVYPLRGNQDPAPRLHYCFFWLFLLGLCIPSLP